MFTFVDSKREYFMMHQIKKINKKTQLSLNLTAHSFFRNLKNKIIINDIKILQRAYDALLQEYVW